MSIIPAEISAGFTFSVLIDKAAYPAPDWVVTLAMRGPVAQNLAATAEGTQHKLAATAAVSATWPPGVYAYSLRATKGFEVFEIESGKTKIFADLAQTAAGGELRSHARIALDNIQAVIEKRATQDQQRYSINNRELWRTPIPDLLKLRNMYRSEVRAEELTARGGNVYDQTIRMRLQ